MALSSPRRGPLFRALVVVALAALGPCAADASVPLRGLHALARSSFTQRTTGAAKALPMHKTQLRRTDGADLSLIETRFVDGAEASDKIARMQTIIACPANSRDPSPPPLGGDGKRHRSMPRRKLARTDSPQSMDLTHDLR